MGKKAVLFLLTISLITGAFALVASASDAVPVNNAEVNARTEVGPGVNCDICDGEPIQEQKRVQERRSLQNGENGEYRMQEKRAQRFNFQRK
ncbi:hypothetical protein [Natronospora cellulosivora (SeqCode)]